MNSLEIAKIAVETLNNKKALNIHVIDVVGKSSFTDYLILANGSSKRQIHALADEVEDALGKLDINPKNIEGKQNSEWVLMDYGDAIINVLTEEARENYNIEKVWGDCKSLNFEEIVND